MGLRGATGSPDPAVPVSPYIEPGTVFRARDSKSGREIPPDHTAFIKTITNRFALTSLTRRDAASADASQVLTLAEPRTGCPLIGPLS